MQNRRDKGVAAYAAAISIGAAHMDWGDVDAVAERLRCSAGLTPAGLWAVVEAVRPFVKLGQPGIPAEEGDAPRPPSDGRAEVSTETEHPAPSDRIDLKAWALKEIEQATGHRLKREGRGHTYTAPSGRSLHLRSMRPFDRGGGRSSYWFGLPESCWNEADLFVLVCGTDGILVVPVADWLKYQSAVAQGGPDGTDRQPSVWRLNGRFELRVRGQHIDVTHYVNRFDLL